MKRCAKCGGEFSGRRRDAIYCSAKCKFRARKPSTPTGPNRQCSRCHAGNASRGHRWCGGCRREYDRARLLDPAHLEAKRQRQRDDYAEITPEKRKRLTETNRRWLQSEHGKASHRRSDRRYSATERGRDRRRQRENRRRAKRASVDTTLTPEQWNEIMGRSGGRCFYCKKKRRLTMDHVVPLSKGGAHAAYNVVPACGSCNSSKGAQRLLLL